MTNQNASILEILANRYSTSPAHMREEAPDDETLRTLLQCAMSAPDHGNLKPWRFHIIRGDARKRFGAIMRERYQILYPQTSDDDLDNIATKPLRAPLIIVVGAKIHHDLAKVPPQEQITAASIAAGHIVVAAQAAQVGAIILSGWSCFDPIIKDHFGYSQTDAIIGYIYMGMIAQQDTKSRRRPDAADFTKNWTGS
ncbi:MAG: nitroreductase [Pseudomonadota bacterium]